MAFALILTILLLIVMELNKNTLLGWLLAAAAFAVYIILRKRFLPERKHRKLWGRLLYTGVLVAVFAVSWPPVRPANSVDAAVEKHVPVYEIIDDKIKVTVNHVMEDEHFIEWISMVTDKKEITVKFNPGEKAECQFCYVEGAKLYAYCNKHGLWQTIVK